MADKIIREIRAAEARAQEIIAAAQGQARQLVEKARTQKETMLAKIKAEARTQAEELIAQATSQAGPNCPLPKERRRKSKNYRKRLPPHMAAVSHDFRED